MFVMNVGMTRVRLQPSGKRCRTARGVDMFPSDQGKGQPFLYDRIAATPLPVFQFCRALRIQ